MTGVAERELIYSTPGLIQNRLDRVPTGPIGCRTCVRWKFFDSFWRQTGLHIIRQERLSKPFAARGTSFLTSPAAFTSTRSSRPLPSHLQASVYANPSVPVAMAAVDIFDVKVLGNPAPFASPLQFEITYEVREALKEGTSLPFPRPPSAACRL